MKKLFFVANWKSHKTEYEAKEWLEEISNFLAEQDPAPQDKFPISNNSIIVCPSFTILSKMQSYIIQNSLPIELGAQDVSPFDEGNYTGEVSAKQIKEFANYVIIGHSERRSNFSENDHILEQKVYMAQKYNLTPIFCVSRKDMVIPKGVSIVAYEPLFAVGSGNPDTPENANETAMFIKTQAHVSTVLYGGSVTSQNVASFTNMPHIDGVLVGRASLTPQDFFTIISHV